MPVSLVYKRSIQLDDTTNSNDTPQFTAYIVVGAILLLAVIELAFRGVK